ncbi:MAG TPA: hypothetical protein VFS90_05660 [Pyrinomonadaceae bacterium]|nr:hypothetical protein [Pyrinomonadaceae bacterium]
MRKLRGLLLSIIVLLFLFTPMFVPTEKAKAVTAVRHYKVYYTTCIVGPPIPEGELIGEWTRECDGTWIGWGTMPGSACSYYSLTYGDLCEF